MSVSADWPCRCRHFLIGVLLIWLFAVELQWLPSFRTRRGGRYRRLVVHRVPDPSTRAAPPPLHPAAAITLGLYQMTLIMRLVRAEMLEVLRTDYIKFARARGLSEPRHYISAMR